MGKEAHVKKNTTFKLGSRHKRILALAVESEDFDSASDAVRSLIDRLDNEKGYTKREVIA